MKSVTGTVEVKSKDAQGNEKVATAPVTYNEFENHVDILTAMGLSDVADLVKDRAFSDDQKTANASLLGALNYGVNLKARTIVRNELQSKLEGPDKAINKMIADLIKARAAAGKPISEEKARALALALMAQDDEAPAETPATA
jgi:hypothetical protein